MDGWIKLHRCLLDNGTFGNPDLLKVWIWCLLKAGHKEHRQMVGFQEEIVPEGGFIFGRKAAAVELKMSESKIYRLINRLKKLEKISVKSNNKWSLVTVDNWALYQGCEQQSEQQVNNKRTTNEQQVNTNKNVKKDKNEKKEDLKDVVSGYTFDPTLMEAISDFIEHRKSMKKPLSAKALDLTLKNLDKLTRSDREKVAILNQSIANGWQGVFALKQDNQRQPYKKETNIDRAKAVLFPEETHEQDGDQEDPLAYLNHLATI